MVNTGQVIMGQLFLTRPLDCLSRSVSSRPTVAEGAAITEGLLIADDLQASTETCDDLITIAQLKKKCKKKKFVLKGQLVLRDLREPWFLKKARREGFRRVDALEVGGKYHCQQR